MGELLDVCLLTLEEATHREVDKELFFDLHESAKVGGGGGEEGRGDMFSSHVHMIIKDVQGYIIS